MQFAEGLSNRQPADAVRARLDWKYALGLTLEDIGFDFSLLSEFRSRLKRSNLFGENAFPTPDLCDGHYPGASPGLGVRVVSLCAPKRILFNII